jgi:hypothetical protein
MLQVERLSATLPGRQAGAHFGPPATIRPPGRDVADHVGQRGGGAHDVVDAAKEGCVGAAGNLGVLGHGLEQLDVGPAAPIDAGACQREHLGADLDTDQAAGGADPVLDQLEVEPRAAADVEDDLARPRCPGARRSARDKGLPVMVRRS